MCACQCCPPQVGALLFELTSGVQLFPSDRTDDHLVDVRSRLELLNWRTLDDARLQRVLADYAPAAEDARDLIKWCLLADPAARPSMGEILKHPFICKVLAAHPKPAGEFKLIDMDAATTFGEAAAEKYSSAYAPPELARARLLKPAEEGTHVPVCGGSVRDARRRALETHRTLQTRARVALQECVRLPRRRSTAGHGSERRIRRHRGVRI